MDDQRACARALVASLSCCNLPRPRFPLGLSLSGAHLLVVRSFTAFVSHPAQALAFEPFLAWVM